MNLFYEDFPANIKVRDQEYEIITDFREWIRFCDMVKSSIPIGLKASYTLDMFKGEVMFSDELPLNDVWDSFVRFLNMQRNDIESGDDKRDHRVLFSYEYDGPYILAAFMHDYVSILQR